MVSFSPLSLHPCEGTPGTHWVGGRVSPRTGLGVVALPDIEPGLQPLSLRYTDGVIPALRRQTITLARRDQIDRHEAKER